MLRTAIVAALSLGLAALTVGCLDAYPGPEETGTVALPLHGGQFCGGIAGFACPDGLACVDDPTDSCDPKNGGADCGGICVHGKGKGAGKGKGHGHGAGHGQGRGQGKACKHQGKADGKVYIGTSPDQCAVIKFFCDPGLVHFSDECGCGCMPAGEACGPVTCGADEVCCNPSCGICTPPDYACIQIACLPTE